MVNFVDNEFVELITTSLTLDAIIIEEYPDTLFESQRQAIIKDKTWYFRFTDLERRVIYPFLEKINTRLGDSTYIVRENGQDILVRYPSGRLIYLK